MINSEKTVFLSGTLVTLRLPDIDRDIVHGHWHRWFNDSKTTEFLEHGAFPVSRENQVKIISSELEKKNSLILAIDSKEGQHIGVISLKNIDHYQSRAEIAIVMGEKAQFGSALEAMALLTDHAFRRLNLQKLYAGQHESLWKWVNTLALIGYKVEGFREFWGRRNGESYGAILTGVDAKSFLELTRRRGGSITTGGPAELAKLRSDINFVKDLKASLQPFSDSSIEKLS